MKKMTDLERTLAQQLDWAGLFYEFDSTAIPGRNFRWDFVFRQARLLVEVQGGSFSKGKMGHNSGTGIHRDCEKHFLAQLNGWHTLYVADHHVKRTGEALAWIQKTLLAFPAPDARLTSVTQPRDRHAEGE